MRVGVDERLDEEDVGRLDVDELGRLGEDEVVRLGVDVTERPDAPEGEWFIDEEERLPEDGFDWIEDEGLEDVPDGWYGERGDCVVTLLCCGLRVCVFVTYGLRVCEGPGCCGLRVCDGVIG